MATWFCENELMVNLKKGTHLLILLYFLTDNRPNNETYFYDWLELFFNGQSGASFRSDVTFSNKTGKNRILVSDEFEKGLRALLGVFGTMILYLMPFSNKRPHVKGMYSKHIKLPLTIIILASSLKMFFK